MNETCILNDIEFKKKILKKGNEIHRIKKNMNEN